jgi:hypothetical protein
VPDNAVPRGSDGVAVDRRRPLARAPPQDRLQQPRAAGGKRGFGGKTAARQLDKTQQIAALTATVAVEEIFASVDIERRANFRVQGTEADELRTMTGRSRDPVLLPQIIEQRNTLFEFFEILAHGTLPLDANLDQGGQRSQARMVGETIFSATQGPEGLQNRSQPR